jgi:hypothetical protein
MIDKYIRLALCRKAHFVLINNNNVDYVMKMVIESLKKVLQRFTVGVIIYQVPLMA